MEPTVNNCFVLHIPHDCWCNAGMASAAVQARLKRIGQGVLEPAQGLTALRAILKLQSTIDAVSQVAVNPFIWDSYIPQLPLSRQQFFADFAIDVANAEQLQASTNDAQSSKAVSFRLEEILQQVLDVLENIVGVFHTLELILSSPPYHCSLYIQVQHKLLRYLHEYVD